MSNYERVGGETIAHGWGGGGGAQQGLSPRLGGLGQLASMRTAGGGGGGEIQTQGKGGRLRRLQLHKYDLKRKDTGPRKVPMPNQA